MNIYLISQDQNTDYDTYNNAVVVANNEDEAQHFNIDACEIITDDEWKKDYSNKPWMSWCSSPEHVFVEYIGEYIGEETEPYIVCSSFNAG